MSCASPGGPVWCGRRGFTRQPRNKMKREMSKNKKKVKKNQNKVKEKRKKERKKKQSKHHLFDFRPISTSANFDFGQLAEVGLSEVDWPKSSILQKRGALEWNPKFCAVFSIARTHVHSLSLSAGKNVS